MKEISERLAALSPAKRALLEARLLRRSGRDGGGEDGAPDVIVPRRTDEGPPPLSFAQQRLWFLDQMGITGHAYNMPVHLRLSGPLDEGALSMSLDGIVRRHAVLRTVFVERDGEPVQIVDDAGALTLPVVDLRDRSADVREGEVRRLAREEARHLFDLSSEWPLRVRLLRLADEEHVLLVTLHHIAGDGWSMDVFVRELGARYDARAHGRAAEPPLPPIQYADFAVWQRRRLRGARLEAELSYWKERLRGLEPLRLPTDRPRPPVESFRGATHGFSIGAPITQALEALGRRLDATFFMTLLAAFQTLLGRYTGQTRFPVGSPIANRTRGETEGLIGFFVNSLVLVAELDGDPSFAELVRRVREAALGAYAHQDLPFEKLVEELAPERDLSRNPLFQVIFALQQEDAVRPRFDLAGLAVAPLPPDEMTVRFDLELHMWRQAGGLRGECLYNVDLFAAGTVARMMAQLQDVLAAAVARPDERLSRLPLLTAAESTLTRLTWNDTRAPYPAAGIHRRFEARCRLTPDATALTFEHAAASDTPLTVESLTYEQVNVRANQLARYLRAHGVGADVAVAVLLDRSPELPIALLAVLKAGGAFVPLDPAYPRERLRFMLAESGASLVLTQEAYLDRVADADAGVSVVRLDDGAWRRESTRDLGVDTDLDGLAYVMFTSGSTGEPKGVAVTHRNVVRLVTAPNFVELSPADVVLMLAPVSFDASTLELWGPLLHGGRLAIFPPITPSLAELGDFIERHQLTTAWLTASLFAQMVDHQAASLRGLRWLLAGGDVLPVRQARAFLDAPGHGTLVNGYGPTENTTFTCCHAMTDAAGLGDDVPIGRPITNTQAYVLDGALSPAPVGMVGELYAGGDGLARGYRGRPAMTADRFVPDPCGGRPGARLYRTGDRARWRDDGTIEFLGRVDRQVKIRGFRVEPGEVERQLALHPGVGDAVVDVRADARGGKRLVAYFVPKDEADGADTKRRALASSQVSQWQTVFDEHIYVAPSGLDAAPVDPLFNTTGWRSSYDGAPIPLDEMLVWADDVVAHVRRLRPRRVLEIGCGTGMLLFRIAPGCEAYHGTDVSGVALDYVREQISRRRPELTQVRLDQRAATDFRGLAPASFDAVILSSVVQYFPDVDYLLETLEGSLRLLRPGGIVFLGDLRNRALLETFHVSVALAGAAEGTTTDALRRLVGEKIAQESELLIDPALFGALRGRFPGIRRVEVHLQRGAHHNELTRFRYHAILEVGPEETAGEAGEAGEVEWIAADTFTLDDVRVRLLAGGGRVGFTGLVNARLVDELRISRLLTSLDRPITVEGLRALAAAPPDERAIEPERIHELAAELGYEADVSWSPGDRHDRFDVAFATRDAGRPTLPLSARTPAGEAWRAYANEPLRARLHARLAGELREYLEGLLPEYMVPSFFVALDAIPATPSGKSDRAALPEPEPREAAAALETAPRTPTEAALATMWCDVLGLPRVGVEGNFFKLGGHSLLATQLVARVRRTFSVELPLRTFFENPTIARLAPVIDSLRGEAKTAAPLPALVPVPERRHEPFPLSDIQQAYWVGRTDIFELGNVSAHMYLEIECQALDLPRFERAWTRLVARHDMLRMVILPDGTQRVLPEVPPYRIPVSDLRDVVGESRDVSLQATRERMGRQVLPADRWPLFELHASLLDGDLTRLHFSLDALIGDAQSFALLFIECFWLYKEPERPAEPLPITFRDYVIAEEQLQHTERYERAREYWLGRVDTLPPAPQLPLAANPASLRTPRFRTPQARFEPALWQSVKERAAKEDVTPAGLMLAVYAEVLGRWATEPRFTINLTLFNRLPLHPRVDELIGDFTSLTLLEVDHTAEEPFGVRARRLQKQLWQDLDHRYFGGLRVMRELARRRGASTVAMPVIFTSTLGLSAMGSEDTGFRKLGTHVYSTNQTPQVWLDNAVSESDGALSLAWNVVDGLFPAELIDDMFASAVGLVRELATSESAWTEPARPRVPARQLAVREAVNATSAPLTGELLHTRFLAQVERRPSEPAVIAAARRLSYAELHDEALALSGRLRTLGAGAGRLVAVVMEKGWEQVVAVLGVSLSGAAYVPMDPEWPRERIEGLLASTGAELVLTQARVDDALGWPDTVHRLCVDSGRETRGRGTQARDAGPAPVRAPMRGPEPDDLAYVIFTSGSTGVPKGVMIDHRGAVNTVLDVNERFGVGPSDRVLALSSLTFDLSVWDIFGMLSAGGAVVMPRAEAERDPYHWAELLSAHDVTLWNSVPALIGLLADQLEARRQAETLRLAMLSGDWIPLDLPDRLRRLSPSLRVVSLGGATEASIWSTVYPIETVAPHWTSIPYGTPMRNQTMHVLDERLEPCPDWVAGDLYIGGVGLALGYWRDEERTRASFVTRPLGGERLYRTGDQARYWPDGTIEFLGRRDQQVKVQGYRVELGEIEAALVRHPRVGQAVVAAVGDRFEAKRLVAYVVPAKDDAGEDLAKALPQALGETLPPYMVPVAYVILNALPVSANGKVDRKALPVPSEAVAAAPEYVAPRTPLERQLADLWSAVISVDRVGIHDNFFEMGGDSLMAIKLISRIRQELALDLPMRRLFDHPTVAALAEGVETLRWAGRSRDAASAPREEGVL